MSENQENHKIVTDIFFELLLLKPLYFVIMKRGILNESKKINGDIYSGSGISGRCDSL